MPFTFTVPNEYGYVVLTATATASLAIWHSIWAGGYRKAAGIKHPNAYATPSEAASSQAAYLFNCAQRAHANYTENQTTMLTTLLVGGLKYPLLASAMGIAWDVFRLVYAFGYVDPKKKEGKGRAMGLVWFFPQLGLGVLSALVGWELLMA